MSYESLNDKLLKGKKDKFFVSVVPVTPMGEVLLGKRTQDGVWTTPGGGAEPGEEPHQAARRELFEEAGLVAPENGLELVNVSETPRGFKLYSFLWRMPSLFGEAATPKLDPDKEVKSWKLYRPEDFPAAMSSEENASRLKTIREALMKLYGVSKADADVISLTEKLNKGGPGSGQAGHVTAQQPSHLHPHVADEPGKPVNKLQTHLTSLEHGKVMPGMSTKSGKPVVNDMDAARAHGYDVQDHVDAMNAHYELAHKTKTMLDKFKMAGHKIPAEGEKIAKFHAKKMKEHMKARQYLEERKKNTEAAIKEKKAGIVAGVKKSITQMGSGLGDRDLDVGSFAQANGQGNTEWMEKLYTGMHGYVFGDDPRHFETDAGILHLAKVDDGIYSGVFTKTEEGLADNAKIRIERITIPELVQLMIAKEWIHNHMLDEDEPDQVPEEPSDQEFSDLSSVLMAPTPPPAEFVPVATPPSNDRLKMLELICKLLG